MSQGTGGGLQSSESGKAIIFRVNDNFFWQKPASKNGEKKYFLYLLTEKNGIHSVQRNEVPEIRNFTNNYCEACESLLPIKVELID